MTTVPYRTTGTFTDRYAAGAELAERLRAAVDAHALAAGSLLVVGVTEGGLPLALQVAQRLGVPIEPAPVVGVPAPHQRMVRVGMVVDDGTTYVDHALGDRYGARGTTLEHLVARATDALLQQMRELGDEPGAAVAGRDVLLVDDLIDSGVTLTAGADWLRRWGATSVIGAVAAGTTAGIERVRSELDGLVVLHELDDHAFLRSVFGAQHGTSPPELQQLVAAARSHNESLS